MLIQYVAIEFLSSLNLRAEKKRANQTAAPNDNGTIFTTPVTLKSSPFVTVYREMRRPPGPIAKLKNGPARRSEINISNEFRGSNRVFGSSATYCSRAIAIDLNTLLGNKEFLASL